MSNLQVGYHVSVSITEKDLIVADIAHGMFDIRETVLRQVLDLREQKVRDALIARGWTPPPTTPTAPTER